MVVEWWSLRSLSSSSVGSRWTGTGRTRRRSATAGTPLSEMLLQVHHHQECFRRYAIIKNASAGTPSSGMLQQVIHYQECYCSYAIIRNASAGMPSSGMLPQVRHYQECFRRYAIIRNAPAGSSTPSSGSIEEYRQYSL